MNETAYPKISIGLPIYNSEKFIRKRIENILLQTFRDFELIISDNASTDNSVRICEEFMERDSRIKLHVQEQNIGQFDNFNFVLKKSKGKYFTWAAADDIILPEFLEKNFNILETKKNVVTSASKLKMFGEFTDSLEVKKNDSVLVKIMKKIKTHVSYMDCFPVSGKYEKKVCDFLKNCRHSQIFYGLHRTDAIKECIISESFVGFDTFYALCLLRYGDVFVIDEVLMEVFDGGDSRDGDMVKISKMLNKQWYGIIFSWIPMTRLCRNEMGLRLFLKNIGFFIKLNLSGALSHLISILRKLRRLTNSND